MRQIKIAAFIAPSLAALGLLVLPFAPEAGAGRPAAPAKSGDGIWQTIESGSIAAADWQAPAAGDYRVLRLNKDALVQQLARAPMERTGELRNSPAVLSLPMPDGSFQRFLIEESPVMDAELVALYPEIKSYRGQGIEDGTATVRFDWTPRGFHALVLSAGRAVNILPPNQADLATYASYYDQGELFKCDVTEQHLKEAVAAGRVNPEVAVGSMLRTYRISIAATNEFCVLVGGNTVAGSTAAINSFLNGINAIWERELSVHMNLVNAPSVVYAGDNLSCGGACTGANDPYTNGNTIAMLNEVRPDLAAKVGIANYNIGHVLGTNSGGVAYLGVVCRDTLCNAEPGACKGGGASGMTAPAGNSGSVGLWAHELGHQFNGNHTQNGETSNCVEPNRNGTTAFEPGSGTTILSYVGICGSDNLANTRDLRWHAGTFAEISNFLAGAQAMGCAVSTATGNNIPTVNAGAPFTIPRNTPFTLTATGTDADPGDVPNLTFIWEQVDAGGVCPGAGCFSNPPYGDQVGDPVTTTRPLFRAFTPIPGKSRTFPSLTYILNNANVPPATVGGFQTAENLPSVSRTMNFRATVRDNRAGFGGVNDSSVAITVAGGSGPFAVLAPNGGGTLSGAQTITWSVAGTNAAPVSAANVKISLSTDGGNTFPTILTASTPNTGTAAVTLPNGITSTAARIKIEAVGNIFFDVSDANFTVVPADTCPAVSDISPKAGNVGNTVTITGVNFTNGGNVTGVKFTNNVTAAFTVVNNTTITTTVPTGAVGGPITLSKAGCPDVQTASFSICSGAPFAIAIDDGGVESASSNGSGAYYVNRLTPGTYPATLTQVSIFWASFQSFPQGTAINIVAGPNSGGTANIDSTSFQTFATTSGPVGGFTTYTLPNPVTITAGDFVVGFQVPTQPAGSFPIATDTTNPASRSYVSGNGTNFTTIIDRNYMIRAAQVFTGCSAGGPTSCTSFAENFDGVTAPALPAGWVATNAVGPAPLWVTATTTPDTAPNYAAVDDPAVTSDKSLDTPGIPITSASAQLRFRNFYSFEGNGVNYYDGAVLEVSSPNINGGAFTDITNAAVGGSFVSGGYVGTIAATFGNPLAGRAAWGQGSNGYLTTVANLGPNVAGQTIKLRFRMGSDSSVGSMGWQIDSLTITTTNCAPTLQSAVSRKNHGLAGAIDINLPLTGPSGVECRTGGGTNAHQVVLTFPGAVTFGSAAVTSGVGTVSSSSGNGTSTVTVNLTGVSNAQRITLTLANVNNGTLTGDVAVPMGLLLGDSNGDGSVNSGDATITRNRSGQSTDAINFRSDYNLDGNINAADVTIVRGQSGNALP